MWIDWLNYNFCKILIKGVFQPTRDSGENFDCICWPTIWWPMTFALKLSSTEHWRHRRFRIGHSFMSVISSLKGHRHARNAGITVSFVDDRVFHQLHSQHRVLAVFFNFYWLTLNLISVSSFISRIACFRWNSNRQENLNLLSDPTESLKREIEILLIDYLRQNGIQHPTDELLEILLNRIMELLLELLD